MPSSEITPGGGKEASPGDVMAMLTKMQQDMEEAAATKDAAHEIAVERLARDIDAAHAYDREVFATSMKRCREREFNAQRNIPVPVITGKIISAPAGAL